MRSSPAPVEEHFTENSPLYNSRGINVWIRLLKEKYSYVDIEAVLRYAGMKPYEIADQGHWFSQTQIDRFYEKVVQQEFFDASFDGNGEFRIYVSGFFSRAANAEIIRKIKQLARDAHQLRQDSDELPLNERFGSSLIMAIRPWEVKVFDELRRVPNEKKF